MSSTVADDVYEALWRDPIEDLFGTPVSRVEVVTVPFSVYRELVAEMRDEEEQRAGEQAAMDARLMAVLPNYSPERREPRTWPDPEEGLSLGISLWGVPLYLDPDEGKS